MNENIEFTYIHFSELMPLELKDLYDKYVTAKPKYKSNILKDIRRMLQTYGVYYYSEDIGPGVENHYLIPLDDTPKRLRKSISINDISKNYTKYVVATCQFWYDPIGDVLFHFAILFDSVHYDRYGVDRFKITNKDPNAIAVHKEQPIRLVNERKHHSLVTWLNNIKANYSKFGDYMRNRIEDKINCKLI